MVRAYNFPVEYVLYEMSLANIILYGSVLPTYDSDKGESDKQNEVINADDPKNRELVRKILFNQ